jgi:hypothetical protein
LVAILQEVLGIRDDGDAVNESAARGSASLRIFVSPSIGVARLMPAPQIRRVLRSDENSRSAGLLDQIGVIERPARRTENGNDSA